MAYIVNYHSQQDPKWKSDKLGFSRFSIGTDGCAITSLAMLVKGFGYDENPSTLNKKLKNLGENNGFIGPLVIWGSLPILFPKITYKNLILCRDHDTPLAQIDASLAKGQPVLVEVDRSPASGLQNHWVILYEKQGDDYLMTDPWPHPVDDKETLLTKRYGFGRSAKKIITAVLWYEMQGIAPPPPTNGFHVQVSATAASGLRLRAQPTTASNPLALEATGSYLRVLEDENSARQKIAVINEWLHVQDSNGVEGYIAAWYVDVVSESALDPEVDPDPELETEPDSDADENPDSDAETLKVYVDPSVGENGLRMRKTPSIGGNLITVLDPSTELTTLDDSDTVHTKLGVFNEWLHVKDGTEHEGYVAAWYLLASLDDIPASDPDTDTDITPDPDTDSDTDPEPDPASLSVIVFPSLGISGLRMRATPNLSGRLLTVLKGGTKLSLLEGEEKARAKIGIINQWLHIRTAKGVEGYVAAWYVLADNSAPDIELSPDTLPDELTVYVIPLAARGLRMRSGPSTGYPITKVLMPNTALTVLDVVEVAIAKIGAIGEWLHVQDGNGVKGYVAAWYVIR